MSTEDVEALTPTLLDHGLSKSQVLSRFPPLKGEGGLVAGQHGAPAFDHLIL